MTPKRLLSKVVLLAMLFVTQFAIAQDRTITGKIVDESGNPVVGATVAAKGTQKATATDASGNFKLNVGSSVTTLIVSSVDFTTKEVSIVGVSTVNVPLVRRIENMSDVVVVAYGTRRKTDLTGAVTSLSSKDFQKGTIASSDQLLVGKVAGLQVTSGGGAAGDGSTIRIRGGASLNASNDPLIVIDGVPVESNGIAGSGNLLGTINPNDIESISILKDASATALYGSRASNGVIMITSKKGTRGKLKFNFSTQLSQGEIPKYVDVLSADEVRSIINADAAATGNNTYKNLLGTANTNWQKQIYQTAATYDHNFSMSGAIGKVIPFRASVGYIYQRGLLKKNTFDRTSLSLNMSPKFFKDHLSVNVAAKYAHVNNDFSEQGAIGSAVSFDPTQPVYSTNSNKWGGYYQWVDNNGNPINTNGGATSPNPLGMIYLRNNTSVVDRIIGNVQMDYKLHFFPDLHIKMNLGIDNAYSRGDNNADSNNVTVYNLSYIKGRFETYKQNKKNTLAEVSLNYSKELKDINTKLDVMVGHTYQDFLTNVFNYAVRGQNGVIDTNSIPRFATDKPRNRLESYIGQINLNIASKYMLTASIRRDASSKFSPDNRVGYFPAAAAAWKINEEFFKNSHVVSELKLRLGWGVTGQQDGIGNYGYIPIYAASGNTAAQYQFGNTFYTFLRPGAFDANLKWETTTTTNAGFDFGFWNNRITGSVDVYQKKTKDLLASVPVAPGANFDITLTTNVGNVENKGVEVTINTIPVRTKNFTWNFGFNATYNKTKITNLLKNPDPNFKGTDVGGISGGTGNFIGKFLVGYAPYTFFVYKQVYDKTTGKPIEGLYEDMNRDGKIDANDKYLYKKPAPDVFLGFNTDVTYKKWTLGFAGHASLGNYLYNNYFSAAGTLRNMKDPLRVIRNVSTNYLDTKFTNNQYNSDYYIENASFFRLDNINLSFNAGKVFKGEANLRVSANVQNVLVITNYRGLDPEVSNPAGIDGNIYPRPRVYTFGLNLDF